MSIRTGTRLGQGTLALVVAATVVWLASGHPVATQAPANRDEVFRQRSREAEVKGLAEPFKGITTNGTPVAGLFRMRPTGVSTRPSGCGRDGLARHADRRPAHADDLRRRRL